MGNSPAAPPPSSSPPPGSGRAGEGGGAAGAGAGAAAASGAAGSGPDASAEARRAAKEGRYMDDDSRYAMLVSASPGGKVSREAVLENLQVSLSKELAKRLFETLNGGVELKEGTPVDKDTFARVVHALERASRGERRRVVFFMFDPSGQGRVRKEQFRRMVGDLLRGFDGPTSANAAQVGLSPDTPEFKTLTQMLTDAAYALHCQDPKRGMTYEEWFAFAKDDPDTCKLLGALDKRSRNRILDLRKLM